MIEKERREGDAAVSALPRQPFPFSAPPSSIGAASHSSSRPHAPALISLESKDPATHFDAAITACTAGVRASAGRPDQVPWSGATEILLPRAVEPDEPTSAPNQPQPIDQDPPSLHFAYLRPVEGDSDAEDENDEHSFLKQQRRKHRRRKGPRPSLEHYGTRLLLAEWHIGADPRSYAWHNPYEGEKNKAALHSSSQVATSRKARKKRDGTAAAVSFDTSSQSLPSSFSPAFPPSSPFPASSQTYFPPLAPPPSTPARPRSRFEPQLPPMSSQDWTQVAATQPAIAVTAPVDSPAPAQPPFAGAASQTVPGAFGSRLSAGAPGGKDKKKGKKRVSGF